MRAQLLIYARQIRLMRLLGRQISQFQTLQALFDRPFASRRPRSVVFWKPWVSQLLCRCCSTQPHQSEFRLNCAEIQDSSPGPNFSLEDNLRGDRRDGHIDGFLYLVLPGSARCFIEVVLIGASKAVGLVVNRKLQPDDNHIRATIDL
jgi:hypothetical protein